MSYLQVDFLSQLTPPFPPHNGECDRILVFFQEKAGRGKGIGNLSFSCH